MPFYCGRLLCGDCFSFFFLFSYFLSGYLVCLPWSSDSEASVVTKTLKDFADILSANPQIDAVYSLDDETSIGVLQAIADAGRTDIKAITGGGGCQEYFQLIEENKDIAVSSSLYSPLMVRDCFDVALAVIGGETVEPVKVIPSAIVDASNVADYLDPNNTIY